MDILTLDLRVHEVESDGTTRFFIVHRYATDPTAEQVALLQAPTKDAHEMRQIAHLLANAPDMQRAGLYNLQEKRYADPALFKNLTFTEVSEEEFKAANGGELPTTKDIYGLQKQAADLDLPDRVEEDFPATYTHDRHDDQGIAEVHVADLAASEDLDALDALDIEDVLDDMDLIEDVTEHPEPDPED